jgi:dihydroorotate dehydrogenase (NAD+) catalytic subunit
VVRTVRIPVIGLGGIMDHRDALQFLIAGARAVQVGTANLVNPTASLEIVDGLRRYCVDKGIRRIADLVGTLKV